MKYITIKAPPIPSMFTNRAEKATNPPSLAPQKKNISWQIRERVKHPSNACVSLRYFKITPAIIFDVASAQPNEIPAPMLLPGREVTQNNATEKDKKH